MGHSILRALLHQPSRMASRLHGFSTLLGTHCTLSQGGEGALCVCVCVCVCVRACACMCVCVCVCVCAPRALALVLASARHPVRGLLYTSSELLNLPPLSSFPFTHMMRAQPGSCRWTLRALRVRAGRLGPVHRTTTRGTSCRARGSDGFGTSTRSRAQPSTWSFPWTRTRETLQSKSCALTHAHAVGGASTTGWCTLASAGAHSHAHAHAHTDFGSAFSRTRSRRSGNISLRSNTSINPVRFNA
jgi:hypothetical protein